MFRFFGYRSFEPEYDTMKNMRAIGIDTITFMVSNNTNFMGEPYTRYQPTWIWEREYDFALFDQYVNDILAAVPDAKLICCIDLNPPQWWYRRGGGKRFDAFNEFGRVAALEDYRNDLADYLQAVLRHATEKFPGRIKAFVLMGGKTTEWFDCSLGVESLPRLAAFRKYMAEKGLPVPEDIPPYNVRYSGVPESGNLLRTPEKNALALEYWKFNSKQSADTLEFFIKKAREILAPEIGLTLCYGYIFELWPEDQASWAQLEYERIFSMPEIDFAAEPISYGTSERGMGGSPLSMIPMQTLKVRGKNIMNSVDTTTFTSRFPKAPGRSGGVAICGREVEWKTPEEVTAGIKREMAFNLINGCSTWYFDMWGGWWDSEAAQATLKTCRKIWDTESLKTPEDVFETLLVADPENMFYINDMHPDSIKFANPVRKALSLTGTAFTTASFNDLKLMALDNYKLIILCHPFDLDGEKMNLLKRTAAGKTVMFIYGPGIIHDGKWSPENVEKICGTVFATPGVQTVAMPDFNAVYVHEPKELNGDDMRKVLKQAGAHCWCDKPVPVYANARLAAIHIGRADTIELKFPKKCTLITELFSGRTYENTDRIVIETDGPDTLLFRYGK